MKLHPYKKYLTALAAAAALTGAVSFAQEDDEDVLILDAFEVYSSSQVSAAEAQRNADIIGSFLGTDAIGDLPDENLGDALTRLAGVNVVNDSEVSIRGLEGKLNSIRINGMDIPQSSSTISTSVGIDTRNFDVSAVPVEIVDSVSVIKSITADLDADAIGGIVDVRTASALALDERLLRYKLEYIHDELGDESGYGFSVNYGDKLSENVGLYLTVSYRDEDERAWKTEHRQVETPGSVPIPELERLDPRETFGTDERLTISGSLDWQVSDNTRLWAKPYINMRDRTSFRHRIRARDLDEREGNSRPFSDSEGVWWFEDGNGNPLGDWVDLDGDGVLGSAGDNFVPLGAIADEVGDIIDDSGIVITPFKQSADLRIQRRMRERPERENNTYSVQFGGLTETDEFELEYKLQLSKDEHSFIERRAIFSQGSDNTDFQRFFYDASDPYFVKLDAFVVTQDEGHIPVEPRINPFEAPEREELGAIRLRDEKFEHDHLAVQVDYTKFDIIENWDLKVGIKSRMSDRTSSPALRDWSAEDDITLAQFADYLSDEPMGTHDGLYSNFGRPVTSVDPIIDFFESSLASDPTSFERNEGNEFVRLVARFYDFEESINAAYVMGKGYYGPLTILAGVRVEQTDQTITWTPEDAPIPDGFQDVRNVTTENDYVNWFPSIVGIYRFGNENEFVLRGAVTTTIARPDYDDLIPFDFAGIVEIPNEVLQNEEDEDDGEFILGNPDLKEQTGYNYDLALEWYPNNSTTMSIGLFYKDLQDFLMNAVAVRQIDFIDDEGEPDTGSLRSDFVINGGERTIQGLEFSWRQSLDDILPDLLDGFGFVFNYTYIDGEQSEPVTEIIGNEIVRTGEVREGQTLQGQPENIVNAQLFYEQGPVNIRFAYTWVDDIKNEIFDVDTETFQESRGQLDMSLQYHLTSDLRLFLDVTNLTEEDDERIYQVTTAFPESVVTSYRRWVFGIRGSF